MGDQIQRPSVRKSGILPTSNRGKDSALAVSTQPAAMERLLDRTESALASMNDGVPRPNLTQFELEEFQAAAVHPPATVDNVTGLEQNLRIELARTRMPYDDVLKLHGGAVLALDSATAEPVDVRVGDRLVARGEILVHQNRFCVRVTELADAQGQLKQD